MKAFLNDTNDMTTTLQTPLHSWHSSNNGRIVDFAGWSMPVQYGSIVEEHHAVRKAIGLFDISHMGRLNFGGENAAQFLDHVATRRIVGMKPGQIRYGLVCNESGGILDDVLVYRLEDSKGNAEGDFVQSGKHPTHQMVVNASNREKIIAWFNQLLESGTPFSRETVWFDDVTLATAMIAVQGPLAVETMQPLLDVDLQSMKYYTGSNAMFLGGVTGSNSPCFVSRTGYTGEDGCEITVDAEYAIPIWEAILKAGNSCGAMAAGLGARDTLRLEAAMPLYGHELSEEINPVQARPGDPSGGGGFIHCDDPGRDHDHCADHRYCEGVSMYGVARKSVDSAGGAQLNGAVN